MISPFQSKYSNSVSIWIFSIHHPYSPILPLRLCSSHLVRPLHEFLQWYCAVLPLRHFLTPLFERALALQNTYLFCLCFRELVLSLHAIFLTTLLTILVHGIIAVLLSAPSLSDNSPQNHHFLFHLVPSTDVHWYLEQTLLSFASLSYNYLSFFLVWGIVCFMFQYCSYFLLQFVILIAVNPIEYYFLWNHFSPRIVMG